MLLLRGPHSRPHQERQPGKHRGAPCPARSLWLSPRLLAPLPHRHTPACEGWPKPPPREDRDACGGENASPLAPAWQTSEKHPHPSLGMRRLPPQRPALALIQPCWQSQGCKPEVFSAITCHP